ncbi:MAG: metal-dependent transcriptional regulator [Hamadaea sp.]|uniref:metal-dependent transcriptional regulator n=1 Tax=Hamadaea sp. NPDC050747 TaxID=3155789 RepID=UPI00185600F7|nr:metal-dependent transcriptional regulator [Hamadaea sp.]NUR49183.1 metal-dependent transcriptional regulator [Hamadaea sp.]NUT06979.1 metal-dependent transcriptional regulator [Hamadaea sp.]
MNDLVDTTEMYLRTILELEEEGVAPLRARIAERLHQSGPTVSQTVARMERDGLLRVVESDRHLELTDTGRSHAVAVMRKHRLAELLLVNVIGMPYEEAHDEACRWEHVMSDTVEQRVYELLNRPTRSPYGNPIPGLDAFDGAQPKTETEAERNLAFPGLTGSVIVRRICESVQTDAEVLRQLHAAGVDPGATVTVAQERDGVTIDRSGEQVRLPREVASRVFVSTR